MKKRMISLTIVSTLLFATGSQAQTVTPSTFNATGGSKEIAGNLYEYSIGEMVLVNTASTPNLIVTQGLLQPSEGPVGISDPALPDNALSVYPNPSDDVVYIQPNITDGGGMLTLTLLDVTGRQLQEHAASLQSGNEKQSVSLKSLAAGTYMLRAVFTRDNQDRIRNFKIQKIN